MVNISHRQLHGHKLHLVTCRLMHGRRSSPFHLWSTSRTSAARLNFNKRHTAHPGDIQSHSCLLSVRAIQARQWCGTAGFRTVLIITCEGGRAPCELYSNVQYCKLDNIWGYGVVGKGATCVYISHQNPTHPPPKKIKHGKLGLVKKYKNSHEIIKMI